MKKQVFKKLNFVYFELHDHKSEKGQNSVKFKNKTLNKICRRRIELEKNNEKMVKIFCVNTNNIRKKTNEYLWQPQFVRRFIETDMYHFVALTLNIFEATTWLHPSWTWHLSGWWIWWNSFYNFLRIEFYLKRIFRDQNKW